MIRTLLILLVASGLSLIACCAVVAQTTVDNSQAAVESNDTPIVLRDLSVIRDKSIKQFSDDLIELSDGSELGWDQVLKANVQPAQQAEFDAKVRELGLPLFRLKSRIKNGDWEGAGEIAIPMYEAGFKPFENEKQREVAYLVSLASMKSSLLRGEPGLALVPFLQTASLQSKNSAEAMESYAAAKLPERDCQRMFSSEIMPVWFDASQLETIANRVNGLVESYSNEDSSASKIPDGVLIYLASIKVELDNGNGSAAEGARLLELLDLDTDSELKAWRDLIDARFKQKKGRAAAAKAIYDQGTKNLGGSARAASFYLAGIVVHELADTTDLDLSKAMLSLLKVPAVYGEKYPALSAAAIFQAAKIAKLRGRMDESQKLIDELLTRYPRTYHGRLVKNE